MRTRIGDTLPRMMNRRRAVELAALGAAGILVFGSGGTFAQEKKPAVVTLTVEGMT